MAIAIDFGTSNTVVSRIDPITKQAITLKLENLSQSSGNNPNLIPSLIYVEDASSSKVVVGQKVRDRGLDLKNDSRFFKNFKRGIGTTIKGVIPQLDGVSITLEQIGEWFLSQILNQFPNEDALILTVPVDSFEAYRNWLNRVVQKFHVPQVRMLDEPTAAALGYGISEGGLLLVVDFGGGTIDLSLVKLDDKNTKNPLGFILKWGNKPLGTSNAQKISTASVLGKAGQGLGGSDLDNWIIDYFHATTNIAINPLTTRLAERLKIQLSQKSKAQEVFFDDQSFDTYELKLDRDEFNTILKNNRFWEVLDNLMTQVLQQGRRQGIETTDIDGVLLVGGTSQIPAVQAWIKQYFPANKIKSTKPLEAISLGALQLVSGIEVKDFLYHSYGIRYWDRRNKRHNWHTLINNGQAYPMSNPVELLLGASIENQPSIELVIGELGNSNFGTEVYFEGDRLITKTIGSDNINVQPLNDKDGARSIPLIPTGNPGSDRLKIQFTIDQDRFLRITVEDLLTKQILVNNQSVVQLS